MPSNPCLTAISYADNPSLKHNDSKPVNGPESEIVKKDTEYIEECYNTDTKEITKLKEQYASMLEGQDISMTIDECQMQMTYENYNKATDFELPEEAKKAEDISEVIPDEDKTEK